MILHVDPNEDSRSNVRESLRQEGHAVRSVGSYDDAIDAIGAERFEQLITEYELGEETGLELAMMARKANPDTTAVLYTEAPVAAIDSVGFEDVVVEYVDRTEEAALDLLLDVVGFESENGSQVSYPRPSNEAERLTALAEYPTRTEELQTALDRLTELASGFFEVETAFVGLIEEQEEVFVSCYNTSFDDIEREDTLCTFTILEEAITVIEDVQADPRFNSHELYADGTFRFYAGAPLRTPAGMAIGTFCLLDDSPRTFSEEDRQSLTQFAAAAMDYFDLHRRLEGDPGRDARAQ